MKSTKANEIKRDWHLIDVDGKTLGRVSTEIAGLLMGKGKSYFVRNLDCGDFVVVTNSKKVKVTGKKLQQKIYYNHSDYVGGLRETTLAELLAKKPEKVIELAVKGMLPKGPLGYAMIKKMKCYAGATHPHAAQQPKVLEL